MLLDGDLFAASLIRRLWLAVIGRRTGQGYLVWLLIMGKVAQQDEAILHFIIIQMRTYRGLLSDWAEIMGAIYLAHADLSYPIHVLLEIRGACIIIWA